MNKNMKNNFEENIMSQIRSGKIGLRSKYLFLAEKIGSISGFILSLLFSIFLINLVLYYVRSTGNLEYLSFGGSGISAFLESFPGVFLLGGIVFTFAAGYFMAKNDISYKHPFVYMIFGLIAVITLSSGVLAASGINDKFEELSKEDRRASFVLKPFFNREIKNRTRGVVGKIMNISDDNIELKTVKGSVSLVLDKIKKNAIKNFSESGVQEGDFVVAIGKMLDGEFSVVAIKNTDKNKLPLIRKRLQSRPQSSKDRCDINKDGKVSAREQQRCAKINNEVRKRCGDDVCDEIESKNDKICPQDCTGSQD